MNLLALNWNDLTNPYSGGAEVHLEELLRRLVTYGHRVTLLCSGWQGCRAEETIEGIRIIRTGNRYTFNFAVPFRLRKLVKEERFDLLIEDINKVPFYTPLYVKLKTLVVIPHLFATTVFQELNPLLATYIYLAEQPLVPLYRGRKFNVISESTAEDVIRRGVPAEDVSVIHCGIDRVTYSHAADVVKYEQPTILYLGRIKKYKSVQHVIKALPLVRQTIPDARLVIVGAGDYAEPLKSLARQLDLDRAVEFTGFVSSDEKVEWMRRSHVAVLPSPKEGWGLTNIEANSVGTVVVAANSPGLRDSVKDGSSGFLYPYGDIEALAEKLCLVLGNRALRERLEQGALQWAEQFDWDRAAGDFDELIRQIAGS